MFDNILLLQEQKDLLITLVEAVRNVPHEKRQEFRVSPVAHPAVTYTASIYHEGFGNENYLGIYRPDVETLEHEGIVAISNRRVFRGHESFTFDITPLGFQYCEYLNQQHVQSVERIEYSDHVHREVTQKTMSNMSINETYHGFNIEGEREYPTMGDYDRYVFRVTLKNKLVFRHSVRSSRTYLRIIDGTKGEFDVTQLLLSRGFNRVCGKIDLSAYEDGEDTEYFIGEDEESPTKNPLPDKQTRLGILNVLYRIKRLQPERAIFETFNVEGFCEILGIKKSDYLLNASYLHGHNYVADSPIEQNTVDKGGIYITSSGIDYLERDGNLGPITNVNTGGGDFVGRDKRVNMPPENKTELKDTLTTDIIRQKDEEVYSIYIKEWEKKSHLNDWSAWTSRLLASPPYLNIKILDDLGTLPSWDSSRLWPKKYKDLELAFTNFRIISKDLLDHFFEHAEERDWMYKTDKFYKKEDWNDHYDRDFRRYQFHVELTHDLTLELTRAANYLCDQIRQYILPSYRIREGKLLVYKGNDIPLHTEYRDAERTGHPYPGFDEFKKLREHRDLFVGSGFE